MDILPDDVGERTFTAPPPLYHKDEARAEAEKLCASLAPEVRGRVVEGLTTFLPFSPARIREIDLTTTEAFLKNEPSGIYLRFDAGNIFILNFRFENDTTTYMVRCTLEEGVNALHHRDALLYAIRTIRRMDEAQRESVAEALKATVVETPLEGAMKFPASATKADRALLMVHYMLGRRGSVARGDVIENLMTLLPDDFPTQSIARINLTAALDKKYLEVTLRSKGQTFYKVSALGKVRVAHLRG